MLTRKDLPAFLGAVLALEDAKARDLILLMTLTGIDICYLHNLRSAHLVTKPPVNALTLLSDSWRYRFSEQSAATVPVPDSAWRFAESVATTNDAFPVFASDGDRNAHAECEYNELVYELDKIAEKLHLKQINVDDFAWIRGKIGYEMAGVPWRIIDSLHVPASDPPGELSRQRKERLRLLRRATAAVTDAVLKCGHIQSLEDFTQCAN